MWSYVLRQPFLFHILRSTAGYCIVPNSHHSSTQQIPDWRITKHEVQQLLAFKFSHLTTVWLSSWTHFLVLFVGTQHKTLQGFNVANYSWLLCVFLLYNFCIRKGTKRLGLVTTVYRLQWEHCKCLHATLQNQSCYISILSLHRWATYQEHRSLPI